MKSETSLQSVVVVEDDPDIREALREMLEYEGYPVVEFENGKEALDHLHESPSPGLIILDLMMPVMNGIQFLRARKNDDALAAIPCFVVSATGKRKEIIREGAAGFLRKPVEASDLLAVVKSHIHSKQEPPRRYLH